MNLRNFISIFNKNKYFLRIKEKITELYLLCFIINKIYLNFNLLNFLSL
jgi:hypothetical protein